MTSAIQPSSFTRSSRPELGIGLVRSEVFPKGTSLPFLATSAGEPKALAMPVDGRDDLPSSVDDWGRL